MAWDIASARVSWRLSVCGCTTLPGQIRTSVVFLLSILLLPIVALFAWIIAAVTSWIRIPVPREVGPGDATRTAVSNRTAAHR